MAAILERIDTKLSAAEEGATPDLATELSAFDALVREEAAESPENAAAALRRKAAVIWYELGDTETARETLQQVISRFPETQASGIAERMIAAMQIQAGLAPGNWFPNFVAKGLEGESVELSALKGKVVLVDFWATWCPPCRVELPNVKAAYTQYHEVGFEIVGISLDKDETKLRRFLEREEMAWPQIFDGEGWQGELVRKYGVMSIPATYLLDREGRIVARDLHGDALSAELKKLF